MVSDVNLAAVFFAAVSLVVSPGTVHRGALVSIHGNAGDCPVGDAVTIISRAFAHTHDFAGVPAVFARVRSGGAFRVTTRIPRTRAKGRYIVTARCGGGTFGIAAHVVVR
jgi:hypothetical protein